MQSTNRYFFNFPRVAVVSYSNQKVRLKWDDSGVALNPELKLLQYNLGQPLELAESSGYMPEKHGKFIIVFCPAISILLL